jgi:DNA-binding XRE family transcriptional regulator
MPPVQGADVGQPSHSGTLAGGVPRPQALFEAPRLRELRLERLLSQERLAKQAGVARESIITLERGGLARAATIQRLAVALQVTTSDLMRQPDA